MTIAPTDSQWALRAVNPKEHMVHDRERGGLAATAQAARLAARNAAELGWALGARKPLVMLKPALSPPQPPPFGFESTSGRHRVLWVGSGVSGELSLARTQISMIADVTDVESPLEAARNPPACFRCRSPAVILLATATPAAWSRIDLVALKITWPLAPIVSVASGLVDGRRRSGPSLAGIDEVPWHDLVGRLAAWLADRTAGRPGTLGLPATIRREDRFLEGSPGRADPRPRVAVAARGAVDLDAVADLVSAAGGTVTDVTRGRPDLTVTADAILWDIATPDDADVSWLRRLVAQRPQRRVIVLESFPHVERVAAMLGAGASGVLGRPGSAEAVAGLLLQPAGSGGIGLGSPVIAP